METPTQTIKSRSFTNLFITILLHLLLWSSLFPLCVQISLFALSKVDKSLFLSDVICMAAAGTSLFVILLHNLVVRLQQSVFSKWAQVVATVCRVLILFLSCTAVLLWITTVGLGVIFTLARQPTCRPASFDTHDRWRKGQVCYVQRAALVVSMLAFIVSFILCFTYNVSHDPYAAGLFGSGQAKVCISPTDLGRKTPKLTRQSNLSFKCRSLLSPIVASSPLMISSPLRATMNASDEKSHGLGISSPVLDVEKSPLLARTPSPESIHSRNDSVDSSNKPSQAYLPSGRTYQPSRVPTAYVPSPHGTHLYSPKHLPKSIVSAMSEEVAKPPAAATSNTPQRGLSLLKRTPSARRQAPPIAPPRPQRGPSISRHIPIVPQRAPSLTRQVPAVLETTPYEPQQAPTLPQIAPTAPQRGPVADAPRIQTTALYTSRRVSSMFMTPTSEMAPPMMAKTHSPETKLDTFPASPPVHLPLTKPRNLYQTRRAPTPYNPMTQATGPAAPRRFPVPYTPSNLSNPTPVSAVSGHSRCASSMALPPAVLAPPQPSSRLAPPPSIRTLNSQLRRGVSYASNTSSIYSRLPSDDK